MDFIHLLIWVSFGWIFIHLLINGVRYMNSDSAKLPPGPYPLPIVGSLFKLGEKPHESLTNLAKIYGPLMAMKLGFLTTVVVSSASVAKQVLQKNDHVFSNRPIRDAVKALNHHKHGLIWLPTSNQWRNLRRICNLELFNTQKLDGNEALRHQKVKELLAYVKESCKIGVGVNIGEVAFTTSLNILSNTLFSIDMAHFNSNSMHEFKDAVRGVMEELGKPNFVDYFPVLRLLDPQGVRRDTEIHFGKLYKVFDELIQQRLQFSSSPVRNDFLNVLLEHSKQNPSEFGHEHIKAVLQDLFVAGTDTTSTTLEWAMAELLHNPDVMAKARMEIEEIVGKEKMVEEKDIARLPYLLAVVKETFRLHPPAPLLLPHKTDSDVEICGFTVPKHAQVIVNVWAIGRDPSIWENPMCFVPERFLGSEMDFKGVDFELIPFSAGRRMCPGMPYASRVLHLMLASLLQSFDWKLKDGIKPEDMNMEEKFGLTLQKVEPLVIIPVKM